MSLGAFQQYCFDSVVLEGRSICCALLVVMRRVFAAGFHARFVLSFLPVPSVLNYSFKESRFFDPNYDSTVSLPRPHARPFARSLSRTSYLPLYSRCSDTPTRQFKANSLEKKRTAKPATKAGHKSARVVPGRRHHLLRMLVDHLMCRDGKSEESLLERRLVRTLSARRTSLRRKDFVPPLPPMLSCWSNVIAASETGVSKNWRARGIGPRGSALASMGEQAAVP